MRVILEGREYVCPLSAVRRSRLLAQARDDLGDDAVVPIPIKLSAFQGWLDSTSWIRADTSTASFVLLVAQVCACLRRAGHLHNARGLQTVTLFCIALTLPALSSKVAHCRSLTVTKLHTASFCGMYFLIVVQPNMVVNFVPPRAGLMSAQSWLSQLSLAVRFSAPRHKQCWT